tara:strand:- start:35 stop:964 length:930 start_codon:yes stop_codon:yes gene_type:complete
MEEPVIGNRLGFINTLDDTLNIYRSLVDNDQFWDDKTKKSGNFNKDISDTYKERMDVRDAVEHIKHCDLYHMGEEFNDMLTDWGDQYDNILFPEMRFSKFSRPSSRLCYVRIAQIERYLGEKDIQNLGFLTQYYEDGMTSITAVAPFAPPMAIGAYHSEKGIFFDGNADPNNWEEGKRTFMSNVILAVAGAFELINNPRFVVSKAAGTRAQRKQMKREQGISLEVWHKITWNIDEPVVVEGKEESTVKMPLHYNRGYPKKAKEHYKDTWFQATKEFPNGRWWQWIEGYWAGHPAYGIKKGYHAPTLKVA